LNSLIKSFAGWVAGMAHYFTSENDYIIGHLGMHKRIILFFTRTKIYHFLSKRLRFSNRPVSPFFGGERGLPIDRYYIDKFLLANKEDIKGRCLEVGDRKYLSRFGQDTECLDVLCPVQIGVVNVVANLETGEDVPFDSYDCFVMTQTLPFIFDVQSAVKHALQLLKPGGVLLITVPGITRISTTDAVSYGHYWAFTAQSIEKLFSNYDFSITQYGNVASAKAFLDGLAAEELSEKDLGFVDERFPVTIGVRVVK